MTIKTLSVNPIQENCYIVSEGADAIIIDCGALSAADRAAVTDYIDAHGLQPRAHLLTHAHFDHLFGAMYLYQRYGLQPRLAAADDRIYATAVEQAGLMFGGRLDFDLPPLGTPIADGEEMQYGALRLRAIATPGHTPGGMAFYFEDEAVVFTGDSLFCRSIGRTDLPGGDYRQLIESLSAMMSVLPDDVTAYPGHGPSTTIGQERGGNPFLL